MLPSIWPLVAYSITWNKNPCKSAFNHGTAKADAFHIVIDDCCFKIILGGFIDLFVSIPIRPGKQR